LKAEKPYIVEEYHTIYGHRNFEKAFVRLGSFATGTKSTSAQVCIKDLASGYLYKFNIKSFDFQTFILLFCAISIVSCSKKCIQLQNCIDLEKPYIGSFSKRKFNENKCNV